MIDFEKVKKVIVKALKEYLGCEVVLANQTARMPKYPYASFSITTPLVANRGTWGRCDDGVDRKQIEQIWSITVQSDKAQESMDVCLKAYDWLDHIGSLFLSDNNIVVQRLENITNRDNLLSVGYEYRNGFDVVFSLMDEISVDELGEGEIETIMIKDEERTEVIT